MLLHNIDICSKSARGILVWPTNLVGSSPGLQPNSEIAGIVNGIAEKAWNSGIAGIVSQWNSGLVGMVEIHMVYYEPALACMEQEHLLLQEWYIHAAYWHWYIIKGIPLHYYKPMKDTVTLFQGEIEVGEHIKFVAAQNWPKQTNATQKCCHYFSIRIKLHTLNIYGIWECIDEWGNLIPWHSGGKKEFLSPTSFFHLKLSCQLFGSTCTVWPNGH